MKIESSDFAIDCYETDKIYRYSYIELNKKLKGKTIDCIIPDRIGNTVIRFTDKTKMKFLCVSDDYIGLIIEQKGD